MISLMRPRSASGRRRRPDAGFTIIEVAMAGFVMAFGIATSIIAMQTGFKTVDVARGTTLASQILQSEMERLRLMSWTTITALSTATDSVAPAPSGTPAGVEMFDGATYFSSNPEVAGRYLITRTVAADSTRPADVIYITISVTWTSYDGRSHTRSFQSMYSKDGLYDYYYTLANS
jgi:Tfp pilus assembly protein PilV